jgi:hypothetical protein
MAYTVRKPLLKRGFARTEVKDSWSIYLKAILDN